MSSSPITYRSGQALCSREDVLSMLRSASAAGERRFLRQLALKWLTQFAGDLEVGYWLAKDWADEGKPEQAAAILLRLCTFDPEFREAQSALAAVLSQTKGNTAAETRVAWSNAYALGDANAPAGVLLAWADGLRKAREALAKGDATLADSAVMGVLVAEEDSALVAVTHLRSTLAAGSTREADNLAGIYHSRWPDCVAFTLVLGDARVKSGQDVEGMALLRDCVSRDVAGQVAVRLWGAGHPYSRLWPVDLSISLDIPIPVAVGEALGLNVLPSGQKSAEEPRGAVVQGTAHEDLFATEEPLGHGAQRDPASGEDDYGLPEAETFPAEGRSGPSRAEGMLAGGPDGRDGEETKAAHEAFKEVERELEALAQRLKAPSVPKSDGRFPTYVVLSSLKNLQAVYGQQNAQALLTEMHNLAQAIAKAHKTWAGMVFLPDDPQSLAGLGMTPIQAPDPWQIKSAIAQLDGVLGKKGAMIGAVLIVGGQEVVPFHELPNPTDDPDATVPSDNPYATTDANYFVPEWPVGRLIGTPDKDPALLVAELRAIQQEHTQVPKTWPEWLLRLADIFPPLRNLLDSLAKKPSADGMGYSAAVWRRASLAAFRPIGEGKQLFLSPPESGRALDPNGLIRRTLNYFNLHGADGSPNWYGQKDGSDRSSGPDYPVALRPEDLPQNGHVPQFVFTEACYGAQLPAAGSNSIALRFFELGAKGFVGSTVTSYGSVFPPLIGADLLGNLFWQLLTQGLSAGEAFTQAKLHFARQMTQQQGYLDGEDQKTLISFVYYGDPLAGLNAASEKSMKLLRAKAKPVVSILCDREDVDLRVSVHPQVVQQVKKLVGEYLPGIENSRVKVGTSHPYCPGKSHQCPTSELGSKVAHPHGRQGFVVTFTSEVRDPLAVHQQIVRATVNAEGKLVKLAESR